MQVRKDLGVGEDVKLLLFNFGGQVVSWNKCNYLPPSPNFYIQKVVTWQSGSCCASLTSSYVYKWPPVSKDDWFWVEVQFGSDLSNL
jgi:hypothetical protein